MKQKFEGSNPISSKKKFNKIGCSEFFLLVYKLFFSFKLLYMSILTHPINAHKPSRSALTMCNYLCKLNKIFFLVAFNTLSSHSHLLPLHEIKIACSFAAIKEIISKNKVIAMKKC